MEHGSGTIGTDGDPAEVSDRASKCAIARGVVTESTEGYELSNVVETALAKALVFGGAGEAVGRGAAELQSCRAAEATVRSVDDLRTIRAAQAPVERVKGEHLGAPR